MVSATIPCPAPSLFWQSNKTEPVWDATSIGQITANVRAPIFIVRHPDTYGLGLAVGGCLSSDGQVGYECVAALPPMYPEWLGDRGFCEIHQVRFPYVAGAMARGIASTDMVVAMAQAGMLGFFGAAGLSLDRVEAAINDIQSRLGSHVSWGCNLIHTPEEPALEMAMVDAFIRRGVRRVSASAFRQLTPALAAYAYKGISKDLDGRVSRQNYVFAKISRPETAAAFLNPAPNAMVEQLVNQGLLTAEEAALAVALPVAEDITVESDSGGHTDNQILTALFPTIAHLRDECMRKHGYTRPIRVGAAGGLGTPSAVAAAFSLGAAYVLTGSVNQACVEADVAPAVKAILAEVKVGDVAMAPCADMFEAGTKVQVLKRRTLYAVRASRLYALYTQYDGLDAIPADVIALLESQFFRQPIDAVWQSTVQFFQQRNPAELEKAQRSAKHKMALVFRWYLGQSSRWPIVGDADRVVDYQVWCGPAMASFNDWVKGSFMEAPEERSVVQVARNLLEGAARISRAQQLRSFGVAVPNAAFAYQAEPLN